MHIYQICCCASSLFFNVLLSFLIIFKSPTKLGMYKYLMLYISMFEAAYSISDVVVGPTFHSYRGSFLVFRYFKGSVFSSGVSTFLTSAYCGCFGFSIALFGVHFIYRYGAIEHDFYLRFLSGKKIIVLFVLPLVYYLWWAGLIYVFLPGTPETDRYLKASILETYGLKIEELTYVAVLYHPIDQNGKTHPNWGVFLLVLQMFFMMLSSMSCVFYFGIHCYLKIKRTLEATRTISNLTKSLQQQLFHALVIQTMIPIVLMYTPAAVIFISPMLQLNLGFNTTFVGFTIATYPAIDPLPNMLIIKSYRKAIQKFFGGIVHRSSRKIGHSTAIPDTVNTFSNTVVVSQGAHATE